MGDTLSNGQNWPYKFSNRKKNYIENSTFNPSCCCNSIISIIIKSIQFDQSYGTNCISVDELLDEHDDSSQVALIHVKSSWLD